MQRIKELFSMCRSVLSPVLFLLVLVLLSACAERKNVRFKINSVPKGAHVLYQVKGGESPCQDNWIYLGNTPFQGVKHFSKGQLADTTKITLRVMHNGFYDQSKEWYGEGFWEEIDEKDVIFWTPELIRNVE